MRKEGTAGILVYRISLKYFLRIEVPRSYGGFSYLSTCQLANSPLEKDRKFYIEADQIPID